MYSRVARRPGLFAVSQRLAALGTRLVSGRGGWMRIPAWTGWGYSKDLPGFAARPFRERFRREGTQDAKEMNTQAVVAGPSPLPGRIPAIADRSARFTQELTAVGGHVVRASEPSLAREIVEFLKSRGIAHIHLEPGTLDESALSEAGIAVSHAPDPAIRVGVTRALCGLADTGSILVADGAGDPLHASLLTEVHLAVLRASAILPSLEDAMSLPRLRESRAAVFITGPSRTADIEMTLTIGVHGPGELRVYLIDDGGTE